MSKVSKHYRIREDIALELNGLMNCINRNLEPGQRELKEIYIVESAIVAYIAKVKRGMEGIATLKAKCLDLSKAQSEIVIDS